ncbi:hypothetical protein Huta_0676 [Halorhabdus utahensis DSM 12940]|uniref:Uncharacterized protein n=1 Tax=Halorhabdus utahensis (strain DSM 12940 / JCM 11049 / AX-2) TaxID=519442 RepID=C7NTE0_HALUD|nr:MULTISPECIES: hypothetical protein [Halorhabdus]ACV10862.1 hypothetical protein Huta_0676 [Halorhabdus utahensis DSM 12940]WEL20983.1 Uncharacterized protein HBNXHr_0914 [Halorhabdus sp. BNX81]
MDEFTFMELHFEDGSIPAGSEYEGGSNRGELNGTDENDESGGAGLGIPLLGLAVLAIGIALARKLLAGDGEDIEIEA